MTTKNDTGRFETKHNISEQTDLLDNLEDKLSRNNTNERTQERILAGARAWLAWCEDSAVNPREPTTEQVRKYIAEHRGEWADTTTKRRVATVSRLYHLLDTDPLTDYTHPGEDGENPVEPIDLVEDIDISTQSKIYQTNDDENLSIPPEYVNQMVDAVDASRESTEIMHKLIIRLAWDTAARAVEISRIKWRDVDPENQEIQIQSAKLGDDHRLSDRRVWWQDETHELLKKWMTTYRAQKSQYADESPYLFPTEHSDRISEGTVSHIIKDAAHAAGVNEPLVEEDGEVEQWKITAHRLRHGRLTYLANKTSMDINSLRRMAGHSKIETTMQYVHEDWDADRAAFQRATK